MLVLPAQVPGLLDGAKILPGTAQQRHRRQRDDRRTDRQTDVSHVMSQGERNVVL